MKKIKRSVLVLLSVLFMSFSLYYSSDYAQTVCFADFGDTNDYDYSDGGSSDYSNSGWDDYSWDDDDDDDDNNIIHWDNDDSGSDNGSNLGFSDFLIAIVMVIIIIIAINKFTKPGGGSTPGGFGGSAKKKSTGSQNNTQSVKLPDRTQQIADIIRKEDEYFDSADLVAHGRHIFVELQNAWSERNLEPVRDMLHPNLYDQTQTQVNIKIKDKLINKLERISVTNAYITSYRREKEFEHITIFLDTQMIDYQIKEDTQEVVAGDKTTLWKLRYKMTLTRSIGIKTPKTEDKAKGCNCPNCSAPLDITAFGKCEYCGTIVTTGKYGWVVSSLNNIKYDTRDEGIQGVTD